MSEYKSTNQIPPFYWEKLTVSQLYRLLSCPKSYKTNEKAEFYASVLYEIPISLLTETHYDAVYAFLALPIPDFSALPEIKAFVFDGDKYTVVPDLGSEPLAKWITLEKRGALAQSVFEETLLMAPFIVSCCVRAEYVLDIDDNKIPEPPCDPAIINDRARQFQNLPIEVVYGVFNFFLRSVHDLQTDTLLCLESERRLRRIHSKKSLQSATAGTLPYPSFAKRLRKKMKSYAVRLATCFRNSKLEALAPTSSIR